MEIKIIKRKEVGGNKFILTTTKPVEFEFIPGQFVLIEEKINGELIKRPYTISSHPSEQFLMFYIKRVENGKMSTKLAEKRVGESINISNAMGVNHIKNFKNLPNIVYLTAGCGVAGVRSIVLEYKNTKRQIIIHQEKRKELLIWQDIFKKYGEYYAVLSREEVKGNNKIFYGHVQNYIQNWLIDNSIYYIIGGKNFMIKMSKIMNFYLKNGSLKNIDLHTEGF